MAAATSGEGFSCWRTFSRIVPRVFLRRPFRTLFPLSFVMCFAALPTSVRAQLGPSLDIGTGLLHGFRSGDRQARFGASAAAQFAARVKSRGPLTMLVGVNAAVFVNTSGSGVVCVVLDPSESETNRCLGDFPDARVFTVQAGMEHQVGTGIAFRFLAGPALYKAWDLHARWGAQGRADVALHSRSHVAMVFWTQAGVMPVDNAPVGVPLLFGLGLRVQ